MVHRTVNIAILPCQFTSTVSSLPMLLPSYEVKGPIGHFHASFYLETMFSLGKRRYGRGPVGPPDPYWASKSHLCGPPAAHKTVAGLVFQAHNGLKCHPVRSKVTSNTFIPHGMPKPWNHWFCPCKTHTFRCSQGHFCTQNPILWNPRLHNRRLP